MVLRHYHVNTWIGEYTQLKIVEYILQKHEPFRSSRRLNTQVVRGFREGHSTMRCSSNSLCFAKSARTGLANDAPSKAIRWRCAISPS